MGIERLVDLTITRREGARGLTSQGYPVILTNDAPNASYGSDITKRYSINSLSTVGTDFGTGSATYKAFQNAAKQSPKVKYIYVAKRTAAVATVKTITITDTILSGQTVALSVNGTAVSVVFASSSSATMDSLATAIAAVEGIASAAHSTGVITVTATAEWVLTVGDVSVTGSGTKPTFAVATSTPGRTVQDDIADIVAENNTPYLFYLTSAYKGTLAAAAEYIETLKKIAFLQTNDSAVKSSSSTDIGSLLKAADYTRTAVFYTSDTTKHWPMALAALCLAYAPGAVMFNGKVLTGITGDDLTDAEIGYLEGKNVNNYVINTLGSEGMVLKGVMADGNQIHATRDQDYFQSGLEGRLGNVFKNNPKVTINQRGKALFEGAGQGWFNQMLTEHVFDADYPAEWAGPENPATDVPEEDQSAHLFSGFTGRGKIENAAVMISANIDIQV